MKALRCVAALKTIGCILLSWGIIGMLSCDKCDNTMAIAAISGGAIGIGAVLMGASELFREEVCE